MDRTQAVRPDFQVTERNAEAVAQLCARLEGIPLAIELAAARVNMLQVSEILNQLQGSFVLLSTDNRTASLRQQTLQASMDWSWGLLTEAEQTFMRQLAVFAGGWSFVYACEVFVVDVLSIFSELVFNCLFMV